MTPVPQPDTTSPRPWWRWVLRGGVAVVLVAVGWEAARVHLGNNRHEVIPGRVYRSSQPSGTDIREMVDRHGIRTVINLRGTAPLDAGAADEFPWYRDECAATHDLNVSQEDITLSAYNLPPVGELKRLLEVLDRSEYPVLVHCKAGADRTGLISALSLLLYTDATVAEARVQLLPRFGHWPVARTLAMDQFLDMYEAWLRSSGTTHTRDRLRGWILNDYLPGPARSLLAWVAPPADLLPARTPHAFRVRCENRSATAWQFKPGHFASVHVAYTLFDANGKDVDSGRTGLRNETIPPGQAAEVVVPLRGLKPGRYTLVVELHDATAAGIPFRTNSFVKLGDESLVRELDVK